MKKKYSTLLIIFIMSVIIIVVGCEGRQLTKEEVYEDFQNQITKINSYTCTAKVEAIGNQRHDLL